MGALAVAGFGAGLAATGFHLHRLFVDRTGLPSPWVLFPDLGRYLAWPAVAALGILIVWFSPRQSGALFGVLFLSIYTRWGVVMGSLSQDNPWFSP